LQLPLFFAWSSGIQGLLPRIQSVLLPLKKRQSRRGERGLAIPNERRATQSGAFSGATPQFDKK
ncbi:MAG: hypothetical protein ABW125_08740, partial [Candidatus Thiodiazotropha lotti]